MKVTLLIFNIISTIAAICWVLLSPGWDSFLTCLTVVTGLIAQIHSNKNFDTHKSIMKQKIFNDSINYQSNSNINNIHITND